MTSEKTCLMLTIHKSLYAYVIIKIFLWIPKLKKLWLRFDLIWLFIYAPITKYIEFELNWMNLLWSFKFTL